MTKHKRGRPKKHESGGQISIWFDEATKGMIERLKKKRNMNESLSDVTNYLIQVGLGSVEGIEPHYKEMQEGFDDFPRRKSISKSLRFEVFKRDSFTCQYCGRKAPEVTLHVDHVVPVSKGGQNDISNLVTACQDCNLGKGARPLNTHTISEKDERREQIKMLMTCQSDLLKMLSLTLDK